MAENRAEFVIRGLASEEDVQKIREGLEDVDGVMAIELDRETGAANVDFDYDLISEERVTKTVRDLGYEVE